LSRQGIADRSLIRQVETKMEPKRDEFFKQVHKGNLHENTIVLNNLAATQNEFETKWEMPLRESWHNELIKK
jgi:hypothetical protein